MDCQIIMGAFSYFYINTFIKSPFSDSVSFFITLLTPVQQVSLYKILEEKLTK